MKLEKTFHDEIQQIFKLSSLIKVIPWTAGESSRSKIQSNIFQNFITKVKCSQFFFSSINYLFHLGNGLLIIIMSYAKYGIDVHEKTVTNQLAHQGCATLLTGNVFAFTSYLTRLIFGPLRKLKVQGSFKFLKYLECY